MRVKPLTSVLSHNGRGCPSLDPESLYILGREEQKRQFRFNVLHGLCNGRQNAAEQSNQFAKGFT